MQEMIIGKRNENIVDPNRLDEKRPYQMWKDSRVALYVQDGKIFNLAGNKILGPDSTKAAIFNMRQSEMGRQACNTAGISTTEEEVANEAYGLPPEEPKAPSHIDTNPLVKCTYCEKEFSAGKSMETHVRRSHLPIKPKK